MGNDITQRTVLNTGLRVLTGHVSEEATSHYEIRITVGSGSAEDEIDGQAHFLEHMLFNGVNTSQGFVDYKTLKQQRESNGILFNAYTTQTKTCYMATVPLVLGEEGLHSALAELARMVISPALPEDRIDHEKRVICKEWGARQKDLSIYLEEKGYINAFADNPAFGHRVLGEKETIRAIDRQSLLNFMLDHYTQSNTSVVVTGPVDHQKILAAAQLEFSDMPLSLRPNYPAETSLRTSYNITDINFIPHNYFRLLLPWHGSHDVETDTRARISYIVMANRLNNSIRVENGDVYGLEVDSTHFRQEGYLSIDTSTEPEIVNNVIKDIASELRGLVGGDISEDLNFVRTLLINGTKSNLQNSEDLANNLAYDDFSFRTLYTVQETIDMLGSLTAEEIQDTIKKALEGSVSFVGLGPENTFMPQAELESIFSLPPAGASTRLKERFEPNSP